MNFKILTIKISKLTINKMNDEKEKKKLNKPNTFLYAPNIFAPMMIECFLFSFL